MAEFDNVVISSKILDRFDMYTIELEAPEELSENPEYTVLKNMN